MRNFIYCILILLFFINISSAKEYIYIVADSKINRLLFETKNYFYDKYIKYGFEESVFPYVKKYIYFGMILIISGISSYGICSIVNINIWANVFVKFIICCIVPNIIFYICFHKMSEFEYLKKFGAKIMRKIIGKFKN